MEEYIHVLLRQHHTQSRRLFAITITITRHMMSQTIKCIVYRKLYPQTIERKLGRWMRLKQRSDEPAHLCRSQEACDSAFPLGRPAMKRCERGSLDQKQRTLNFKAWLPSLVRDIRYIGSHQRRLVFLSTCCSLAAERLCEISFWWIVALHEIETKIHVQAALQTTWQLVAISFIASTLQWNRSFPLKMHQVICVDC